MRFESVTAHAFGPFHGKTLPLAPGMNVVYGPNEAGKSTWHAALYAGLCGMRRGGGKTTVDREFEERHRPWDHGGTWEVGAIVSLQDGRRVELRHDLAGRVDSSARDADMAGRDYSNEIMYDRAPDGSRWLGLDRRSFLSTACVRQADIRGVLLDASSLQDELQRAAATAGTDATAAEALERLRAFRAENVGTERAWTKPLQSARDAVLTSAGDVQAARTAHDAYLERTSRVELLETEVHRLERQVGAVRAALVDAAAKRAESRLQRARELESRFTDGPPRRPSEDDRVARDVATALETWRSRPELRTPGGPALPELVDQLAEIDAQLQAAPTGVETVPARGGTGPWGVFALGGVIGGGALAATGLIVPGLFLIIISLGLLAWRLMNRPRVSQVATAPDLGALQARRTHVAHLIDDRREEEREYVSDARRLEAAAEVVRQAAVAAGTEAGDPVAQVEGLLAWQAGRAQLMAEADRERGFWDDLQQVLAGQSMEEIAEEARGLRAESAALSASVDADSLRAALDRQVHDAQLDELVRETSGIRDEWNSARGQLEQFAQGLPSVADAEDASAATARELERVERLDRTLRTTIELLGRAEERVHRDIAPVLRQTVLEWLPRVTNGRYTDCRVNPQTLAVEVCGEGARWRRADLLSHGTAEQLYLLLRLALTRHLTLRDEVCPLILDDPLGACDGDRKREVLETLLTISESVQVVLFTHERDVQTWGRERLLGPQNLLTELDPAGVPA